MSDEENYSFYPRATPLCPPSPGPGKSPCSISDRLHRRAGWQAFRPHSFAHQFGNLHLSRSKRGTLFRSRASIVSGWKKSCWNLALFAIFRPTLGELRYENVGMVLNDGEMHTGALFWKSGSQGEASRKPNAALKALKEREGVEELPVQCRRDAR